MAARVFNVTARRSQGWWALEVTGDDLAYPAFTQVRRLDQGEAMVRDLLALQLDSSPAEIGEVEITPVLDTALADEVSQIRHAREQADKLRAEATAQTRRTALHLKEQGLAQRDISTLLRLSHQAVSQLLAV
jgi:predicted XRE-type DNA-binding protein